MARPDPLKPLRDRVRARRNAVTAKENRIKRNTGVDIRGTSQDPRRPVNVVEKYNRKQLSTYLAQLDAFMSRSIGFKAGLENSPIPTARWAEYKRLEKKYNDLGAKRFNEVKDIHIEFSNMTIEERERRMRPDSKMAQNEIVHRPYGHVERKITNIKNAEALEKIIQGMQKKLSANYEPAQIAAGRKQLNQMLASFGYAGRELMKEVNNLSDSQFNTLWNYTPFAQTVSTISPSGSRRQKMVKDHGGDKRYSATVSEDMSNDIKEILSWAKTLPNGVTVSGSSWKRTKQVRKPRKKG